MNEIILSDLSMCQPSHLLDRDYRHGTWRLVDYRTEGFSGTMIYSGPGMDSGPVTLPLNREGYHAIYVGVHYPQFMDAHVRLRLSDDPAYTLVRGEIQSQKDLNGIPEALRWSHADKAFAAYQVPEAFWKVADLTGQDLVISRFNDETDYGEMYSNLVYLRLVPLSETDLSEYRRELPRENTRRLAAMNDGGIFNYLRTKEDIWAQLEPYRESDVGIMLWACFKGENCTYRTRVGRTPPSEYNPFDRFASGDRWDLSLRALEEQGVDFMTELVEAAHAMGLRIFPSLRMQTPNKPVPREMAQGTFWESHPEFHCRDRNGVGIGHLSLAFPEVRAFWISLLCEALEYGFDGVHAAATTAGLPLLRGDAVRPGLRRDYVVGHLQPGLPHQRVGDDEADRPSGGARDVARGRQRG